MKQPPSRPFSKPSRSKGAARSGKPEGRDGNSNKSGFAKSGKATSAKPHQRQDSRPAKAPRESMTNEPGNTSDRGNERGFEKKGGRGFRKPGGRAAPDADLRINLYGLHTVRAALENPARRKNKLLATENGWERLGEKLVHDAEIEVDLCQTAELDGMVGSDAVHQGVVLICDPLDMLDASELFHLVDAKLLLVLDQITDPHNVGAILRSAVAMNADAVLVTNRNSAAETAVLAKSASGALDMVKLVQLRHLSKGIEELNGMGFTSIGLDSEGPLVLEDTLADTGATKLALVLGSEGKGLRQQTRETCTALARLDMPGPIKSLNVSNAAALSLYAASRYLRTESR